MCCCSIIFRKFNREAEILEMLWNYKDIRHRQQTFAGNKKSGSAPATPLRKPIKNKEPLLFREAVIWSEWQDLNLRPLPPQNWPVCYVSYWLNKFKCLENRDTHTISRFCSHKSGCFFYWLPPWLSSIWLAPGFDNMLYFSDEPWKIDWRTTMTYNSISVCLHRTETRFPWTRFTLCLTQTTPSLLIVPLPMR